MAEGEGRAVSLLFRIAALGLSVAAAVVMGTASQYVVAVDGGRASASYAVVSYSEYNALAYFVAACAISAICSAAALYLFTVSSKPAGALVPLLDAAAQGFLFSAAGAAFAVRGVVSSASGQPGSGGGSVCDAAGAFCGRVSIAAAVAVAALASRDALRGSRGCCSL